METDHLPEQRNHVKENSRNLIDGNECAHNNVQVLETTDNYEGTDDFNGELETHDVFVEQSDESDEKVTSETIKASLHPLTLYMKKHNINSRSIAMAAMGSVLTKRPSAQEQCSAPNWESSLDNFADSEFKLSSEEFM